jgi:hypothetical protein
MDHMRVPQFVVEGLGHGFFQVMGLRGFVLKRFLLCHDARARTAALVENSK